jgi:ornithine cyclodeaminase
MTLYTDVNSICKLISLVGIEHLIEKLVEYLECDFRDWQKFDKSARLASHSDQGVIELMPIANETHYSFKYVNGHPSNTNAGLQTVIAFGALSDMSTGYPLLLTELTLLTAIRTAATSVLAAKYLARKDCKTMALIGNGTQAEFQAIAFYHLLGIQQIRCFDLDRNASEKLATNLNRFPGLTVEICNSTKEAVMGADIVTTATADKKNATIITPDMIKSGMHINGIGGDCPGKTEIHQDVLLSSKIFVEYEPQTRIEGDIQQLPKEHVVTELWEVLYQTQKGRSQQNEVTFFDSVGFALEDYSVMRLVYDLVKQYGLEQTTQLVPLLKDPKNLYSLIAKQEK